MAAPPPSPIYETAKSLGEYVLMHFGSEEVLNPYKLVAPSVWQYPKHCAELCIEKAKKYDAPTKRALDLGCAVGRSSFELARVYDSVVGIDYSHAFIATAVELQQKGELAYNVVEEGEIVRPHTAVISKEIERNKIKFLQGDACNLPTAEELGGKFDVLLLANLICRLHTPSKCLERLKDLVAPGGIMVVLTPCSWLPEFTDKANWLGGKVKGTFVLSERTNREEDGVELRTIDSLKAALESDFTLKETSDEPFLIREHFRKFQLGVAQASIWQRK